MKTEKKSVRESALALWKLCPVRHVIVLISLAVTGLYFLLRGNRAETFTEVTDLHFRSLSRKEIESYVATGEPMDKAGSYGIQGGAALFCERMAGDYYNVMGLPVCRLGQVLKQIAPEVMEETL